MSLGGPDGLPGRDLSVSLVGSMRSASDLLVSLANFDALCLYFDQYRRNYRRNLRFRPLLSEEFRFALVGLGNI
jgi:hypothetical protein